MKVGGLAKEFRDFLIKQNALALAVGVIIGAAMGKVVSGIVDDLLMPFVGLLMPGGEWRSAQWVLNTSRTPAGVEVVNAIKYGDLIGRLIDFAIVALVVFLLLKTVLREKPAVGAAPTTKACPQCLELIPLAATRCRACTSPV